MRYTAATVIALILSDVPGDDLSVIASGLTVPDHSSFAGCMERRLKNINLRKKLTCPW